MRSLTPRQRTGIALAAVALPTLTATVWPLFPFLWERLPPDLSTGRILLGAVLTVVLVIAAALIRAQRRTSFRLWWLILAAWAVAIGAVASMVLLIWLVLGTPGLDLPAELSPRALDAIATRAFAVVAGLGGVALLVIHYRRQRTTEADAVRADQAAQREVTKLFNERFTAAYTELGSEHAAVRLGAVHALAHLADDAPSEEEVQMVIDVLCAYLRMPYTPAPDALPGDTTKEQVAEHRGQELEFASLREVRHTIIRLIGTHLRKPTRWRGKDYDFTGVVFDGGNLYGAVFSGGMVNFSEAQFSGGMVNFGEAQFSGDWVDFGGAKFSRGEVSFNRAKFSGGTVNFSEAQFIGGEVDFDRAKFSSGDMYFGGAEFSGGEVSFLRAVFSGGDMYFGGVQFTGGEVDFSMASGACPKGLLEAVKREESRMVVLPEQWQLTTD